MRMVAGMAIVLLLVGSLLASLEATAMNMGSHEGSCLVAVPTVPFGVQLQGEENTPALLAKAVTMGARWARVTLSWASVQSTDTTPPTYQWSGYDTVLSNIANAGLTPIVTIRENPSWAAPTVCGPFYAGVMDKFANFLTTAVNRYKGPPYNVTYWELYNEPDNIESSPLPWVGGCWGDRGARYAAMLQSARSAIKAADPTAQVILGGLAYDWFTGSPDWGVFYRYFLDDVLASGGGTQLDLFNFHYYYYWGLKRWSVYGTDILGKFNYLKSQYGTSKPWMCSELGVPSTGGNSDPDITYTEEMQANYVVQGYVRAMSAGISPIIWYSFAEYVDGGGRSFGLLRSDGSEKPGYRSYQVLTAQLAQATVQGALALGSGLEGYRYTVQGQERSVLWATDGASHAVAFTGSQVRTVTRDGTESLITDGGSGDLDGQVNGLVTIAVGPDPLYVHCVLFGDFDGDGKVTVTDIRAVASRWRCRLGEDCYKELYDIDKDGDIDIVDVMRVVAHLGDTCGGTAASVSPLPAAQRQGRVPRTPP